jgi:hypothetical protein
MNNDKQMDNVLYIHEHYDWDNNKYFTCRDAKCYQKLLEQKKALEAYQFQVDVDLARKENLQAIEDMIQDPRIDYY